MLSLDNAFSAEELGAWAVRLHERGRRQTRTTSVSSRSTASHCRWCIATGAWHGRRPAVTAAAARTSHSTPAPSTTSPKRSATSDEYPTPAVLEVRGEVFFRVADFKASTPASSKRGKAPFANPAQQRRRFAAAEKSGGYGPPQAADDLPRAGARRRVQPGHPARRLSARSRPGGCRSPSTPRWWRVWPRCGSGSTTGVSSATRSSPRNRRRGGQSRRGRAAAPARFHLAGAALGDRLQVPARGSADQAARHQGQRGPYRPGHAVRDHDPGEGRRDRPSGRPRCTTPRRSSAKAC